MRIAQVAVGTNAIWCVTSDNHVWFRRGVRGELSGISEDAALGNGWVEMVGNMSHVSVAANDQVFAVGSENRCVYFRAGVSESDLTGKKWRQIQCPMQLSRASSMASVNSRNSSGGGGGAGSLNSLVRTQHGSNDRPLIEEVNVEEQSRSAPTHNLKHKPELWKKPLSPPEGASSLGGPSHQRLEEADEDKLSRADSQEQMMAFSAPIPEIHEVRPRPSRHQRSWSPVRSGGSVVGMEAMPESDSAVFQSDSSRDSGVFGDDEDLAGDSHFWQEMEMVWAVCSAGAVQVDVNMLPNWFNDTVVQAGQHDLSQPWRLKIVEELAKQANKVNGMEEREKYELAVDTSSWVKTGEAKVAKMNGQFEECLIELEWVSSSTGGGPGMDSGTLTIMNPDGVTTKMQFSLSEITAVMCVSDPGAPRLAIHSPRLGGNSATIRLQFAGDTDLEDWLSHLLSVCCQINGLQGRPSKEAVWTTTNLGDVFVFDPENLKLQQWDKEKSSFVQEYDLNTTETPYLVHLHSG